MTTKHQAATDALPGYYLILGIINAIAVGFIGSLSSKSGGGYGAILVLIVVVIAAAPLVLLSLGLTFWHLAKEKPKPGSAAAAIWVPGMLAAVLSTLIAIPAAEREREAQAAYEEALDYAQGPGSDFLAYMSPHPIEPENGEVQASIDGGQVPHFVQRWGAPIQAGRYEGYRLARGQTLLLSHVQGEQSRPLERFEITPPNYDAYEPLVRKAKTDGPEKFLLAREISTAYYVYRDRVETAAVLNKPGRRAAAYATAIKLLNYTGKNIARVRIGDWDLLPQMLPGQRECDRPLEAFIPAKLAAPFVVSWQERNDDRWQSLTINALPEQLTAPAGHRLVESGVEIILGWSASSSARRFVRLAENTAPDDSEGSLVTNPADASFNTFLAGYSNCTAIASEQPRAVWLFNQSHKSLESDEAMFSEVSSAHRNDLNYMEAPVFMAQNFDRYRLRPNQSVAVSWREENLSSAKQTMALPVPDYSRIEPLMKRSSQADAMPAVRPIDLSIGFFAYPDHIESAVLFTPQLNRHEAQPFPHVFVTNRTGKLIARIQINGWELEPEREWATMCGSVRSGYLPIPLEAPLEVRWQMVGETRWESFTLGRLPAAPAVPSGKLAATPSLQVYLGVGGAYRVSLTRIGFDANADGCQVCNGEFYGHDPVQINRFLSKVDGCPDSGPIQ